MPASEWPQTDAALDSMVTGNSYIWIFRLKTI
jgi:hypothetical protein